MRKDERGMDTTSLPTDEKPMSRQKRPTPKRRQGPRPSQYVMRINVLLTQEQFVRLQEFARAEGRPLPNFLRRLIDLEIAQRAK